MSRKIQNIIKKYHLKALFTFKSIFHKSGLFRLIERHFLSFQRKLNHVDFALFVARKKKQRKKNNAMIAMLVYM